MADKNGDGSNGAEKLILIIANRPKSFEGAANFLSRRGYPCSAVADIRQAIKIITAKKPAFVFLSWNLKNAKILQTYGLITKTFNVPTVVFAELTDSKTAAELSNAHLPETMQAPVSGPGIYMRVQRIEKARDEAAEDLSSKATKREVTPDDVPEDGEWESAGSDPLTGKKIWRFKSDKLKGKGMYTFSGDRPPRKSAKGSWETPTGDGIFYDAKADASDGSFEAQTGVDPGRQPAGLTDAEIEAMAARVIQTKPGSGAGPITGEEEDDGDEFGAIMKIGAKARRPAETSIINKPDPAVSEALHHQGKGNEGNSFSAVQTGPRATEYSVTQSGADSKEHSVTQSGAEAKEHSVTQSGTEAKEHSVTQSGEDAKEHSVTQSGAAGKEHVGVSKQGSALMLLGKGKDSILAQTSAKALSESVVTTDEMVAPIEAINKAMVFILKTERFQGHLIVVNSQDGVFENDVVQSLRGKILQYLKESGEKIKELDLLPCQLQEVFFHKWSSEAAEFSAVAGHRDHQWAISFFPESKPVPEITQEENSDMVSVDVLDVLPESALPFDMFIFLPVNGKHFLYVRKGKKLGQAQRDRMKAQNVSKFYIKKTAIQEFKEFCVTNQLSFKIQEFNSAKKAS